MLIGAANVLPSLKERAEGAAGEILTFTDADALRALEVITKRKPAVVAVERVFAGTPRGAALINRIKSDPSLLGSEIRVVSHDDTHVWAGPRRASEPAGGNGATAVASAHPSTSVQPLDQRGTRRAPRFQLAEEIEVLVDGNQAVLVNLSTLGAQLVSATVLKPGQRVRMALFDTEGTLRINAAVAWASFEIPPDSIPRYRAGIEFFNADSAALQKFIDRNKK